MGAELDSGDTDWGRELPLYLGVCMGGWVSGGRLDAVSSQCQISDKGGRGPRGSDSPQQVISNEGLKDEEGLSKGETDSCLCLKLQTIQTTESWADAGEMGAGG